MFLIEVLTKAFIYLFSRTWVTTTDFCLVIAEVQYKGIHENKEI